MINDMDLLILILQNACFFATITTVLAAILVSKLRGKRLKYPPGPPSFPLFGNWLQIGNRLDPHDFVSYDKKIGQDGIFMLRMGQRNITVVSSPHLAKEVLLTRGQEFASRSRNFVFDIFTGKGQDLIFTEYGDHWRKMRRIVAVPFFTNKVVRHYHHMWEAEAAELIESVRKNIEEASTKGIVIRRWLELMVYNNVYKIMFDKRFESLEDPMFLKVKDANARRGRLGQSLEYNFGDFMPFLRPLLSKYTKMCKEVTMTRLNMFKELFVDVRKHVVSPRTTNENDVKCGVDHFLECQMNGDINEHNVLYIIENMNIAAVETTIWTLEWAIALLTNHPEVQTKLRAEIDGALGQGAQVTEPDTHKLPYLQAMIKETLRFKMVVPCLLPHMNTEQTKLGGFDIPKECRIFVNAWWLANDPASWNGPGEFRPERFLEEEADVEANGNNVKYIPFGMGRRSCPGIVMAMPVLGITLGRLVQNYELLPPPGCSEIDLSEKNGQFGMRMKTHYSLVLKRRSFS